MDAMGVMGAKGTARWIRKVRMKGVSQAEIGRRCKPRLPQAAISHFEIGKHRLNWPMARRLAHAFAEEVAAKNLEEGAQMVWGIWFENVEAYGTPDMKRQAKEIREALGFDLPILRAAAYSTPAVIEALPVRAAVAEMAVRV